EPEVERELAGLSGARVIRNASPRGAAAHLNVAFAETSSDVVVLLESGSLPASGWLDLLVAPFDADASCGVTGPSTNMSWNEQGVFAGCGGTPAEISATAQQARLRFGGTTRTLEPLYSLADFCYAVHRRAFDAAGPADEAYGLGPCWEMDFNV